MWTLLSLVGSVIGTLVVAKGLWDLGTHWSDSRRRLRVWQHAVASCKLQVEEVSSASARRLKLVARAGPVEVRLEGSRGLEFNVRVVVVAPGLPGFSEV